MSQLSNMELFDSCSINFEGRERTRPVNNMTLRQAKQNISNANWSRLGIASSPDRRMPIKPQIQKNKKGVPKKVVKEEMVSFDAPSSKNAIYLKSEFVETPDNKGGDYRALKFFGILLLFGALGYYIYKNKDKSSGKIKIIKIK